MAIATERATSSTSTFSRALAFGYVHQDAGKFHQIAGPIQYWVADGAEIFQRSVGEKSAEFPVEILLLSTDPADEVLNDIATKCKLSLTKSSGGLPMLVYPDDATGGEATVKPGDDDGAQDAE